MSDLQRNIRLTIEYDGTHYHGWQSQNNALAVQDVLEEALTRLMGHAVTVTGSSRLDAGVHALGMVANFRTSGKIPGDRVCLAINPLLPEDMVVKASQEVPAEFHSRFDACGKRYRYRIWNAPFPSPLQRHRSYHYPKYLDFPAMEAAAAHFVGTHDFATFMATGGQVRSTVRTMHRVRMEKHEEMITFEICGEGFLYNMVRIMAGTLVDVGRGVIRPDEIPDIILSGDRTRAGRTAPAHGLYLMEVFYEEKARG